MFEGQLALWRHNADLSRGLLRGRQDQVLNFWRMQFAQVQHAPPHVEGAPATPAPFTPVLAAMEAAQHVGEVAYP